MNKITHHLDLIQAYLIHTRSYRDTSLLIDFFTKSEGFVTAVARGIRTPNKNNKRGLLQPFTKLLINYRGKSDLVYLNNVELAEQPCYLNNHQLKLSFYINELLYYLCRNPGGIVYPNLFEIYEETLKNLNNLNNLNTVNTHPQGEFDLMEIYLREFELELLSCIGYGLSFADIHPDLSYGYDFANGFYIIEDQLSSVNQLSLPGDLIINIMHRDWRNKDTLGAAKKLLRSIIQHYIGNKELQSRKLFI